MDARLLGTLSIIVDTTEVSLTSGRQRDVLATLLCNTDKYVSSAALIAVLWGEDPPPNARSAVRTYVMRLRKALGAAGERIITVAHGYHLVAEPDEIDILRFDRRYRAARALVREHRWQDAVDELQPALAEWRGEPLADVGSRLLREQEKSRLTRLCVQALELYYEARLALGGHRDILLDLQRAVDVYPVQERFWAMLMLALYRSGHRSDGLAAYQRARLRLIEDLGIEPGQELREIHEMILNDSGTVTAQVTAAESRDGERHPPIVPRQLPPAPHHFIGRADELDALHRALPDPDGGAEQAPIVSIVGIGGIGKTALAVRWAHRVAERFPDGQMYINLRGFEPVGQPVPTQTALRWLLDGLHVGGARVPDSLEERRALYRSITSDKRLLIVLDNARDENQVRDLLPIGRGCMSVVTSRKSLVGLLVRHGCHTMRLGPLALSDTCALLEKYVGARRLAADPAATIEMAELSGHIPLTASVIASEAVLQPNLTIRQLLSSFGPDPTLLDLFETGDPTTSVRSLLAGTYRNLTPDARRMLRMLGLHRGERISAGAAHGLGATSVGQSRRALVELLHHHLVEQHPNGQFALHPLAREFAAERAHQEEDPTCLHIARARLLGHHQESETHAARRIDHRRSFPVLWSTAPGGPGPHMFGSVGPPAGPV
jgi:DNA-binding SARP family transcriptional activator